MNIVNTLEDKDTNILRVIDQTGRTVTEIKEGVYGRYSQEAVENGGFPIEISGDQGMVSKNGKVILEPQYSCLTDAWYELALGVDQWNENGKLVDVNGNVLLDGNFETVDKYGTYLDLSDGSVVLRGPDNDYYFYDLTRAAENGALGERPAIVSTVPMAGEEGVSARGKNITITFNQEVELPEEVEGAISIYNYENDNKERSYHVKGGGGGDGAILVDENDHRTIVLPDALLSLKQSEKYYVLIDSQ